MPLSFFSSFRIIIFCLLIWGFDPFVAWSRTVWGLGFSPSWSRALNFDVCFSLFYRCCTGLIPSSWLFILRSLYSGVCRLIDFQQVFNGLWYQDLVLLRNDWWLMPVGSPLVLIQALSLTVFVVPMKTWLFSCMYPVYCIQYMWKVV